MDISLRILGCAGGLPTADRWTTSQLLQWKNDVVLIDCGEGTQMRLRQYYPKTHRIEHILISHLHGDHIYGLPGLLSSYTLQRRTRPLHIYGPRGLKAWLQVALAMDMSLIEYPLHVHESDVDARQEVFRTDNLVVHAIPLEHRIPCHGYIIGTNPESPLNIRPEKIAEYKLNHDEIRQAKEGKVVHRPDLRLSPDEICYPRVQRSYAFCTDTRYHSMLATRLASVQNLYLECTYEAALSDLAHTNYHCCTTDVKRIASAVNPDKLIVGHYSARYASTSILQKELEGINAEVLMARDGLEISL